MCAPVNPAALSLDTQHWKEELGLVTRCHNNVTGGYIMSKGQSGEGVWYCIEVTLWKGVSSHHHIKTPPQHDWKIVDSGVSEL